MIFKEIDNMKDVGAICHYFLCSFLRIDTSIFEHSIIKK